MNKVLASLESADGTHCVDLFERGDGTFGFEMYRGDMDGGTRWQCLHRHAHWVFATGEAALRSAQNHVPWIDRSETWRW